MPDLQQMTKEVKHSIQLISEFCSQHPVTISHLIHYVEGHTRTTIYLLPLDLPHSISGFRRVINRHEQLIAIAAGVPYVLQVHTILHELAHCLFGDQGINDETLRRMAQPLNSITTPQYRSLLEDPADYRAEVFASHLFLKGPIVWDADEQETFQQRAQTRLLEWMTNSSVALKENNDLIPSKRDQLLDWLLSSPNHGEGRTTR